ncbi:hypothetical protein B296_00039958 [Ensete ventricosum]|uniref:Uncharacterized protein n=1 Tax=Ensete ventricosum TaxID=4639 RepID=A0A426XMV3_ENSVE|nr:hypothetical protein B296_00039958 [Ensete ventricosum]
MPNPPRQQLRPRQTLLGSRLSIEAGDPKLDLLLLLHGAIGNRGPPPVTVAHQIWCCSSTRSFHLLPFAATSNEPSSGSTVAHLLPPTATDPAFAITSKPRSHQLSLLRGSLYRKPPKTTAQRWTLTRSLRH